MVLLPVNGTSLTPHIFWRWFTLSIWPWGRHWSEPSTVLHEDAQARMAWNMFTILFSFCLRMLPWSNHLHEVSSLTNHDKITIPKIWKPFTSSRKRWPINHSKCACASDRGARMHRRSICSCAQNLKSVAYLWTQWTKDVSTWIWSNSVSSESWRTPTPNMYCTALRSGHRMAHIVVVPWLQTWCDPYFSTCYLLCCPPRGTTLLRCWDVFSWSVLELGTAPTFVEIWTWVCSFGAHVACKCRSSRVPLLASVWRLSCWVFLLVGRNTLHLNNTLFQRACRRARIWFWQRRPLAATCGHLLWRPLAATCGHSIGCKWLQVVADEKRMRAATGGHWRPLAATRVAASGCKWLPMKNQMLVATGGHWRPLEWLQVAASGCRWKTKCWWPLAATCGHSIGCKWLQVAAVEKRRLADTGGHWRPLDWLQVAASGCRWEENAGGHWQPLAATRLAASGCRWEENAGGHWRPLAATLLAASGCKWLPMWRKCWWPLAATRLAASGCKWLPMRRE